MPPQKNGNNTVILVIGPTGAGKSDYAEHAQKTIPGCRFLDLDLLVRERSGTPVGQLLPRIGNDAFLDCCRREVDALVRSNADDVALVAVGAGALQSARAGTWLSAHPGPTIAVVAEPEEVYKRGGERNRRRSFDDFVQTEYSPHRLSLYKAAKHECCVTGLSVEEARDRFARLIRDLVVGNSLRSCS